ncbi:hypothetical protein Tco_0724572 [Tanacetum coccineum]
MSKLDRFLVSESVISGSLNIKAVTLERFLSDHAYHLKKMDKPTASISLDFPIRISHESNDHSGEGVNPGNSPYFISKSGRCGMFQESYVGGVVNLIAHVKNQMSKQNLWALKFIMVNLSKRRQIRCDTRSKEELNEIVGKELIHVGLKIIKEVSVRLEGKVTCGVMGQAIRIGFPDTSDRRLELTQVEELAKVINPGCLLGPPDSWSWTLNNSGVIAVLSSRNMI